MYSHCHWGFGWCEDFHIVQNKRFSYRCRTQIRSVWTHPHNKKVLLRERKRHTARKRAQDADPPPPADWPPPPWLDLTPPPPAGPDPPPRSADWPDPPGWTWPPWSADWPDPPPLADWPDPPPTSWTWPLPHWLTDLTPPPRRLNLTPPPGRLTDLTHPPVDKLTKWNYYLPVLLRTREVMIDTETETEADKMGTEPNGNLWRYLSLCSVNTSHNFVEVARTVTGSNPEPYQSLSTQVHGLKRLGCHAGLIQLAGVTPEVNLSNSMQARECISEKSTLALKPRSDITRSPKQGYQWPHKRTYVLQKLKKKTL